MLYVFSFLFQSLKNIDPCLCCLARILKVYTLCVVTIMLTHIFRMFTMFSNILSVLNFIFFKISAYIKSFFSACWYALKHAAGLFLQVLIFVIKVYTYIPRKLISSFLAFTNFFKPIIINFYSFLKAKKYEIITIVILYVLTYLVWIFAVILQLENIIGLLDSFFSLNVIEITNPVTYIVSLNIFVFIGVLSAVYVELFWFWFYTCCYDIFYISSYLCPVDLTHYYVWLNTYLAVSHTTLVDATLKLNFTNTNQFYVLAYDWVYTAGASLTNRDIGYYICLPQLIATVSEMLQMNFTPKVFYTMYFITWILFIFSTLLSFLFISYLGLYGVFKLNIIFILVFWFFTIIQVNSFWLSDLNISFTVGRWFTLFGYCSILFDLQLDVLSYSYVLLTLTIAVFVFIYTFSYFRYEPNVERLLLFINLFVASMILLVSSGNFFVLYLGWELIGITSFFLINFWSTRMATLKAAFKAYTFNKFSDICLFFAFLVGLTVNVDLNLLCGNIRYQTISDFGIVLNQTTINHLEVMTTLLICSAFIKSAQFGLHIWLPDSMEAPVPASALIHSATLVSAGVYLILRFAFIFELSTYGYIIIAVNGALTAFYGGLGAMFQSDVKRILAYSTISHCGFLMLTTTFKVPEVTLLYLYVHGFFKATSFLCVGNIIRLSQNYQDFRKMGNFWKYLPFECLVLFVCLLNLMGLPFTLGFYMKHVFLLNVLDNIYYNYIILFFSFLGACCGLVYCSRLFFNVFFDFKKANKFIYKNFNRMDLESDDYYSNTTFASCVAIFCLLVVGYGLNIYLYYSLIRYTSISDISETVSSLKVSSYATFIHLDRTVYILSLLNWIIVILLVTLYILTWRYSTLLFQKLNIINFFILFSVFLKILI